jgi:hypothetical protein
MAALMLPWQEMSDPRAADTRDRDRVARIRLLVCLVIAAFICLAMMLLLVRRLELWRRPVLPGRVPQLRAGALSTTSAPGGDSEPAGPDDSPAGGMGGV